MVNNRLSSRNFLCGLLCAAATLVHGSSAWISRHQRYNRAQASRVLPVWPAGGGDGESFVLVTGGAGYIGSHTCLELLKAGEKAVVVLNGAYGYGAAGDPGTCDADEIPPNATLRFEITLLSWEPGPSPPKSSKACVLL